MAFSNDGGIVAVGRADGTVNLWDRSTSRLVATLPSGEDSGEILVAWSPNEPVLATMAPDLSIVLWDVSDRAGPPSRPACR